MFEHLFPEAVKHTQEQEREKEKERERHDSITHVVTPAEIRRLSDLAGAAAGDATTAAHQDLQQTQAAQAQASIAKVLSISTSPSTSQETVRALYAYTAQVEGQLSFAVGDRFVVLSKQEDWWDVKAEAVTRALNT